MPGKFYPYPGQFAGWLWQQAASWIWGYGLFQNTQVCSVCPSLVCLSICGNIIRCASRAKIKTSHSLERLPPFSLPLLSETYDKKTASTRTFPSPRPLRSLASPTLITSWDLTAGWGRLGSQKWTQSGCTVAARLLWATVWGLLPWICPLCTGTLLHWRELASGLLSSHVFLPLPKVHPVFHLGQESGARSCSRLLCWGTQSFPTIFSLSLWCWSLTFLL